MTQEALGKKLNIPQRTYAFYESGQRMIPPRVLRALAEYYNTSVDYLIGLTDERRPYPRRK